MPITFEKFNEYWSFALSLTGVGGAIVAYVKRATILAAIYHVVRGHATTEDNTMAREALHRLGSERSPFINRISGLMRSHNHHEEAQRLDELNSEAV